MATLAVAQLTQPLQSLHSTLMMTPNIDPTCVNYTPNEDDLPQIERAIESLSTRLKKASANVRAQLILQHLTAYPAGITKEDAALEAQQHAWHEALKDLPEWALRQGFNTARQNKSDGFVPTMGEVRKASLEALTTLTKPLNALVHMRDVYINAQCPETLALQELNERKANAVEWIRNLSPEERVKAALAAAYVNAKHAGFHKWDFYKVSASHPESEVEQLVHFGRTADFHNLCADLDSPEVLMEFMAENTNYPLIEGFIRKQYRNIGMEI